MGVDVGRLLDRDGVDGPRLRGERAAAENPGVVLGAILGRSPSAGRDKVTIIASRASRASAPGSSS